MKKLKNRFKNIKPQTLLTHVIVTLLYPLARVVMASSQRLLVFTDCLTIVAAILLIAVLSTRSISTATLTSAAM